MIPRGHGRDSVLPAGQGLGKDTALLHGHGHGDGHGHDSVSVSVIPGGRGEDPVLPHGQERRRRLVIPRVTIPRVIPRALRNRLGMLAGAGLLAVLLWRLGTGAFLDGLGRIDGLTLLAALGIGLFTTVLSAWRWCLVARALGIRLPLGGAVASYYRALFLNAALPGSVLGDVHRAVRHGQHVGDIGRGVRAVVLERTAGQVVLIVVGVTVLLAQPSGVLGAETARLGRDLAHRLFGTPGAAVALAVLVAVACALVIAAVVRLRRRRWLRATRATQTRMTRATPLVSRETPAHQAHRVRRALHALRGELTEARLVLLARGSWPGVVFSSVAVLAGHLAMFLLAARVAGATASSAELLPLMLLALLAMALPLNIGGWGPREGVTAWAFGAAGLGASLGLTVSVVYGVLAFAASLPGIAVLVGQWFAGRRRTTAAPGVCGEIDIEADIKAEVEVEEGVLAEDGTSYARTQRVPHQLRAGEADPRDAVAEQDRCHGDVQPVQRPLVEEARHGDATALDQHPAQAAPRERTQQAPRRERVAVRQGQDVDAVRNGPPVLVARAHHPQSGS